MSGLIAVCLTTSVAGAQDDSVLTVATPGQGSDPPAEPTTAASDGTADIDLTPETPRQLANRHFRRGVQLFDQGDAQAALVEFLRSNEESASVPALRNAALCLVRLVRHAEAVEMFDRALRLPAATPAELAELTDLRDGIRAALGTLELTLNVDGARVILDGRDLGARPPSTLRLASGRHPLRVEKPGYLPYSGFADIQAGETLTLDVALEQRPVEPAAKPGDRMKVSPLSLDQKLTEPATPEDRGNPLRTWSWVSVGAGATLTAVGIGAYAMRANDLKQLKRSCQARGSEYDCSQADRDEIPDLKRRADRLQKLGTVTVTAGGLGAAALLLGGIGLWTTGDEADTDSSAGLEVWLTGTGAGVSGRF